MPGSSSTTRILRAISRLVAKSRPSGPAFAGESHPAAGRETLPSGSGAPASRSVLDLHQREEGDSGLRAKNVQPQVVPLLGALDDPGELVGGSHLPPFDLCDDVSVPDIGIKRRRDFFDMVHVEAFDRGL